MTRKIVDCLKRVHNARFLKQTADGEWVEISDGAARDKVSHAMRFAAKKIQTAERKLESVRVRAHRTYREKVETMTTLDGIPNHRVLSSAEPHKAPTYESIAGLQPVTTISPPPLLNGAVASGQVVRSVSPPSTPPVAPRRPNEEDGGRRLSFLSWKWPNASRQPWPHFGGQLPVGVAAHR